MAILFRFVHCRMTHAPRAVWLDVDGTSETGEPASWEACLAKKSHPPLGRSYNYNFPLFDALEAADDVDISSVTLFTAYDANGASHNQGVLRCELIDWIALAHPRLRVTSVATIIDPAFGHGPGAYYRAVIEPCERLLLSKGDGEGSEGIAKLSAEDVIETLSPEDWRTIVPSRFDDILRRQQDLVDAYLMALDADAPGDARMDKERLARYCLQQEPSETALPRVVFLDDSRSYIDQVKRACLDLRVDCLTVHVTPELQDVESFLGVLQPSYQPPLPRSKSTRTSCIIS